MVLINLKIEKIALEVYRIRQHYYQSSKAYLEKRQYNKANHY